MQVLPVLPSGSLLCSIVERRSSLPLESFLRDYFLANRPVIITDCMSHWPAITKWKDVDYLKRVAGDRTVPVEVGVRLHSHCIELACIKSLCCLNYTTFCRLGKTIYHKSGSRSSFPFLIFWRELDPLTLLQHILPNILFLIRSLL